MIRKLIAISLLLWTHPIEAHLKKIASNGSYGCSRSFGAGVYNPEVDRTVVCWNGEGMSIYVREYDHKSKTWFHSKLIKKLDYHGTYDYHNYPSIAIAPDGTYLIFYFEHCKSAFVLRSPKTNSVEGKWSPVSIGKDKQAYPMPVIAENRVFLFYSKRLGGRYRSYRMTSSDDNGVTWSTPVTIIDSELRDPKNYDEVYVNGYAVHRDEAGKKTFIHIGWEMHGGPNGHNSGGKNAYFASFSCKESKMFTASGIDLGESINYDEMLQSCLVEAAENGSGMPFGNKVYPVVLKNAKPMVSYYHKGEIHLLRWTGENWEKQSFSGFNIKGIQRDRSGKLVIAGNKKTSVILIESADEGISWNETYRENVKLTCGADMIRTVLINDFQSELPLFISSVNSAQGKKDYTGKWSIFTLHLDQKIVKD